MNEIADATAQLIEALAVRPEILGQVALCGVLAIMFRRRSNTPAKQRQNGSPVFKLMITRITLVMLFLSAATIIREIGFAIVAGIKAGG